MRKLKIGNTEYRLFATFTEGSKKLISVGKEVQENPYCWDSTFYNVNMSWRRYKKRLQKESDSLRIA